jgi:hypothetical protein
MTRNTLRIVLLLCASLLANHVYAQEASGGGGSDLGIAIRPATFDFHLHKGESAVTNVMVTNSQNKPMQIKLSLGDWVRDSAGNHNYFDAGVLPRSCARWVKLSQSFVEIPANSTSDFALTITAPDSASVDSAMRWAMLFVDFAEERTIPKSTQAGVTTVMVKKQRLGLHIYQTPPSLHTKNLKMIDFKPVAGKKNTYRISVKNTGDVQIGCKAYLELTSLSESGGGRRIEAEPFPMFPDQYRIVDIVIPDDVAKGKYNVIAVADAGEDVPLQAVQDEIEVK